MSKPPSPGLLDRTLRALAGGPLTTAQLAEAMQVKEAVAFRSAEVLLAAHKVTRAVRRHWRRAPEEGYAEWVWRLP